MSDRFCTVHAVSFSFPHQLAPLFENLNATFGPGWTGIVGANGSGKSTLARLVIGELTPAAGTIKGPGLRDYCEQNAESPPDRIAELIASLEHDALRLRRLLGVEPDWIDRWDTLSQGERKRAQIAVALWVDPAVLVLDEPTNHLDLDARAIVRRALEGYRGIGLLISHDRELLDALCERCLFLDGNAPIMRPGGVTEGLAEAERESRAARKKRDELKEHLVRLQHEAARRSEVAATADARRSKRHLSPKDHDGRGRINLAKVSGKDAVGGRLVRQLEQRVTSVRAELAAQGAPKVQRLGITIKGKAVKRDRLLHIEPGELPFGDGRGLIVPELEVRPGDRIALLGSNGSGKSTLVQRLVRDASAGIIAYVPQELSPGVVPALVARLAALDSERRGQVFSAVKRLGSDPRRLMESIHPSPGEARKLLLAMGFVDGAELIVLDEPTNHMDLPSILCIEEALAECAASLLFVTHDLRFATRLATTVWRTHPAKDGWYCLRREDAAPI